MQRPTAGQTLSMRDVLIEKTVYVMSLIDLLTCQGEGRSIRNGRVQLTTIIFSDKLSSELS